MIQGLFKNRIPFCRFGNSTGTRIVIIPGLTDAFRDAKMGAKMLSRQFDALALDHMVTVISRPNDCEDSLPEMAHELWDVLKDFEPEAINLVGISMGGMLCQHLIQLYPNRFNSLNLVVTGVKQDSRGLQRLKSWHDLAVVEDWEALQNETLKVIFGQKPKTDSKSINLKVVPPRTKKHFLNCIQACLNHNLESKLNSQMIKRVQVIGGELDPLYTPQATQKLADEFDQKATILEGCSHGVVGVTANKVQSAILNFLKN